MGTAKWNGSGYEWVGAGVTSGFEKLVCNGGEYEIHGAGIVYDEGSTYDSRRRRLTNLANTRESYES